jgi:hypothetical protein
MSGLSERQYLEHIRSYTDDLVTQVGSPQDWEKFKRAMRRWLDEQDEEHRAGFDQAAMEEEWDES